LRAATRRLREARVSFGHGTTNARDEAAWLVLHALGLPLGQLEPHLGRALSPGELARIEALVDRRIRTRKPTAYLTHEAWLGEHRFYVDERVIVPRSFIAELLRERLRPGAAPRSLPRLDLCTGSGCLAILVALAFPQRAIDAVDISRDALAVAPRNVREYGLEPRDAAANRISSAASNRRYDLIVSNPPTCATR
jgi:ribosomal protein L3 glutamine methyltransferase